MLLHFVQSRYLGCTGGRNVSETTPMILKHVFSIPLVRQLNFAGRGEKSGIGKTDTCAHAVIIRKSTII
jgi:hypothetical protein